jgi:ParB family chromosome partitioning protein
MEAKSKRRLGRGLEALLGPTSVTEARSDGSLAQLPVKDIRPNPYQPRNVFDEGALEELKKSLASSGLLQPIVVRSAEDGGYELIAGERRLRAAQQLGWNNIGAVVKNVDNKTLLTLALVENIQRDALSPIDEALGYERLMNEFNTSHAEVGELVGRDRSTIANALRLLRLPDDVQDLLHTGELSTGHARALLQVGEPSRISAVAKEAVRDRLSVREVEAIARDGTAPQRRPRRTSGKIAATDPEVRRVEDALRRHLGTDVLVSKRSKSSGRITVNFYSNDDLARILQVVLGKPFDG